MQSTPRQSTPRNPRTPQSSSHDGAPTSAAPRTAALTLFAVLLASALLPSTLAFRDADNGNEWATDDALAKVGHAGMDEPRTYSPTDLLPGAELRWEFPRLIAAQLEIGDTLTFVLPGGRLITLPLIERSFLAHDALSFVFSDLDNGATAEIVVHAGRVSGSVRASFKTGFESWTLQTGTDAAGINGDYYRRAEQGAGVNVVTLDEAAVNAGGGDGGLANAGCEDTGALIDVLVAYTDAFRASYADIGTMKAQILEDIARANAGLANANAVPRFRVVEYFNANDATQGDSISDLLALQNSADGWNDEVHIARNDARADLVMLYTTSGGPSAAFQGIELGEAGGFSVNTDPASFAAAQVLGLNMGACFEAELVADCAGYFPYSHAYLFSSAGDNYGTIMSQTAPFLQPIYSNIYTTILGQPTGSESQNNARTMSLTAYNVANFRCGNGPDPDCDNDGILDSTAIATGVVPDCNGTSLPDSCDIALGISADINGDGVPDECPLTDTEFWPNGAVQLDTFGTSASLSSKAADPTILLAAGSPGEDTGASNAGGAYVLNATAGVVDFASQRQLHASDPLANAYFGRSVSALKRPSSVTPNYPARNLVLVSAFRWPQITTAGNFASKGAVYLFEQLPSNEWAQVMMPMSVGAPQPWRYTPPATGGIGAQSFALFGYAAAIGHNPVENSEIIVVGAPGRDGGRGAVYIVRNPSLNVGSIRKDQPAAGVPKTITDASEGDNFGYAVALEDRIPTSGSSRVGYIAGAPGTTNSTGAAYLFERVASTSGFGTTWPTTTGYSFSLNTPVGPGAPLSEGDRYGTAVAIFERLAVVGAPGAGAGKGRIYFWERNASTGAGGRWIYRGYMSANDANVRGFGSSISIAPALAAGEYTVVVGVGKEDVMVGTQLKTHAGAAHIIRKVFGQTGGTELGVRISNAPATGDEFGYSTSAIQGFSLIGAPFKDNGGLNSGAAKLLSIP